MRNMKDSGIEWIGEIPEEWQTIKFKYLHNQSNVGNSIDKDYWTSEENDTVFYTAGLYPIHTSYKDFPTDKYTTQNDILLARNGTPYVYFPITGAAYSDHIIRVELHKDYCKRYMGLCLQQSINYEIVDTVSIATWSVSIWDKQFLCLPPYDEQQAIAAHLDRVCTEIDSITAKTKATIEEYKKLKQAIITQAVTKGIRKGRKMKDSGVEWIGEIPEEWEIIKMKYLGFCRNGLTYSPDNLVSENEGVLVLRSSNIKDGKLVFDDNVYVNCSIRSELFVNEGDILICSRNGSRKLIGKNAIIPRNLIASFGAFMMIFRCKSPKYIKYILDSDVFSYYLGTFLTSTINQLTADNFNNMEVVYCSNLIEQQEIAAYLDEKCTAIDALIVKKEQLLTELESYKKSVIYEYVTGKKEVI